MGLLPRDNYYRQMLEPYFPRVDWDDLEIEPRLPWWWVFKDVDGLARPDRVFINDENIGYSCDYNRIWLVSHELTHIEQYEYGGGWWDFVAQGLRHGYWDSPWEVEARDRATSVTEQFRP
jgi:hypothetical protein